MDKREQRWAKEDAERVSYRKQCVQEVSAEKLACLQEIWAEADLRRLKRRVIARKGEVSKVPKVSCPKGPRLSLFERRQREDERINATHLKQDDMLAEKWRFEDMKRIAKRKAQEHLIYLRRCEQAFKLAARRSCPSGPPGLRPRNISNLIKEFLGGAQAAQTDATV